MGNNIVVFLFYLRINTRNRNVSDKLRCNHGSVLNADIVRAYILCIQGDVFNSEQNTVRITHARDRREKTILKSVKN